MFDSSANSLVNPEYSKSLFFIDNSVSWIIVMMIIVCCDYQSRLLSWNIFIKEFNLLFLLNNLLIYISVINNQCLLSFTNFYLLIFVIICWIPFECNVMKHILLQWNCIIFIIVFMSIEFTKHSSLRNNIS
jgi:hypothetical protein